VLVGRVGFWTKIRKSLPYDPPGDLLAAEITKVIQTYIIAKSDVATAERELMSVEGIQKFYRRLETPTQKYFRDHLRRYLQMYLGRLSFRH
jgi:hypothetical protein